MGVEFATKVVRKPFEVDAVEVTRENIEELAQHIGKMGHDSNTDTPYIHVNPNKVPNVYRVYPGYWVTRMGENIRCYTFSAFKKQFALSNDEVNNHVKEINKLSKKIQGTVKFEERNEEGADA